MIKINPYSVKGELTLPTSKSYLQRTLLLAAFSDYPSKLEKVTWCDDSTAVKRVIERLGASVHIEGTTVIVKPIREILENSFHAIDIGESGLAARMLSLFFASFKASFKVVGQGSIQRRNMQSITQALKVVNVSYQSNNQALPIEFKGGYTHGAYQVDGALSSQAISGLLLGLVIQNGTSTVTVTNMKSTPYLDITCEVARLFGAKIIRKENVFKIEGARLLGMNGTVEGDWSGGANFIAAAVLKGSSTLKGLRYPSYQSDTRIFTLLKEIGADIQFDNHGNLVVKQSKLQPFDLDVTHCPDLFPVVALLATQTFNTCRIQGISRLKNKESDRLKNTLFILVQLGVALHVDGDELTIRNDFDWNLPLEIDPDADHRMAMMAALIPLVNNCGVEILNPECVSKSFPTYFSDLKRISL